MNITKSSTLKIVLPKLSESIKGKSIGMCTELLFLLYTKEISTLQYTITRKYLMENKPKWYKHTLYWIQMSTKSKVHWWNIDNTEIRVKFLNKLISELPIIL